VHLQFWCSYLIFLWTMRNVLSVHQSSFVPLYWGMFTRVNCEELLNFKVFTGARLDSSFEECAPSVTMNCGECSECLTSATP
jgi:hypothetical protein